MSKNLNPTKWRELHDRFLELKQYTGADKSSSYVMNVIYDQDGTITVELGTYDIGEWPRNTTIGPFDGENIALYETEKKIREAEQTVFEATPAVRYLLSTFDNLMKPMNLGEAKTAIEQIPIENIRKLGPLLIEEDASIYEEIQDLVNEFGAEMTVKKFIEMGNKEISNG